MTECLITCELCSAGGIEKPAMYNAKIPGGNIQANLCKACFMLYDCKLGSGKGEKLIINS